MVKEIVLNSENIKDLLKIKNRIRVFLENLFSLLEKEEGKENVAKVKRRIKELGIINLEEINKTNFYTLGQIILVLLVIKEVLHWDDEKFKKVGRFWVKKAIVIKLFSHLFRKNKAFFFKGLPLAWGRFLKDMRLVPLSINFNEENSARFRIEGIMMERHPTKPILKEAERIGKVFFGAMFAGFAQMILGVEEIDYRVEHADKGFEFTITWKD